MFTIKDVKRVTYQPKVNEVILYNDLELRCVVDRVDPNVHGRFCSECYFNIVTSSHSRIFSDCGCPDHVELLCNKANRSDGLNIILEKATT